MDEEVIRRHRRVLNRLEPHLGCVVCRATLVDGRCPTCDPAPSTPEATDG